MSGIQTDVSPEGMSRAVEENMFVACGALFRGLPGVEYEDGPDGMVCDRDGNVWTAVRAENRPGIYCYSPDGTELGYIQTEVPTNVGFGRGEDAKTLYITAGRSLYRIRTNREGYQLPAKK